MINKKALAYAIVLVLQYRRSQRIQFALANMLETEQLLNHIENICDGVLNRAGMGITQGSTPRMIMRSAL